MNRLHVHLHVRDLAQSVRFYSTLFGSEPTKLEGDYAKWMLENPRVNFAISARGGEEGLGHLGIQVESEAELDEVSKRARAASGSVDVEEKARCCYAVSDKAWATDPQGVRWETFHTHEDIDEFGGDAEAAVKRTAAKSACCG